VANAGSLAFGVCFAFVYASAAFGAMVSDQKQSFVDCPMNCAKNSFHRKTAEQFVSSIHDKPKVFTFNGIIKS